MTLPITTHEPPSCLFAAQKKGLGLRVFGLRVYGGGLWGKSFGFRVKGSLHYRGFKKSRVLGFRVYGPTFT